MANISNGSFLDEDMSDITDWTDSSTANATTSQVTFDSKSCMKLDTSSPAGEARSGRTLASQGSRSVISLNLYCDLIGTRAANDFMEIQFSNGSTLLLLALASDGMFVYDGSAYNEVGTNIVVQDTWQEWTFDINWTAETLDVYLGEASQATGVDCSYSAGSDGAIQFRQKGITTTNMLSYVDWLKVGDAFESAATHTQSIIIT